MTTDEEHELRVLLERAVPQLPAPAQRLERVRERMRRRRRRRAVALSAAGVAAVAAAGLLLPGLGDPAGSHGPQSAATRADGTPAPSLGGPSATASGTPSAGASYPGGQPTATEPGYHSVRYPKLTGLRLQVPVKWSTIQPSGTADVYLATQPLGLPKSGCAAALDDFCTPLVSRLYDGSLLMRLRVEHNPGLADKLRLENRPMIAIPVVQACQTVGGTTEMSTSVIDPTGSDVVVSMTACLSHPTKTQPDQIGRLLTTADFT